jgi:hypothetical protein
MLYHTKKIAEERYNVYDDTRRYAKSILISVNTKKYFSSRYLPIYWLEMKELKYSHPFCYENMCMEGQWTVQRQAQHSFASIACDQAIEQTVNRDTKSTGDLRGISLNRGWFCYILTHF